MKKFIYLLVTLFIVSCSIDRKDEVIVGLDGKTSLVRTSEEFPGDNCQTGGLKIEFGLDLDYSLTLEDSEVQATSYVCNGLNGEDGKSSIVGHTKTGNGEEEILGTNQNPIQEDFEGNMDAAESCPVNCIHIHEVNEDGTDKELI